MYTLWMQLHVGVTHDHIPHVCFVYCLCTSLPMCLTYTYVFLHVLNFFMCIYISTYDVLMCTYALLHVFILGV